MAGMMRRTLAWLTEPVPLGRVAAFRTLVYLFIPFDLLVMTSWVRSRTGVSGDLYQPLFIGRLLPLPTPEPLLVNVVFWALLALSLAAATGRAPRALGWPVLLLYVEWLIIAMSYGKVDHDRFAFLVALAVLPSVARARHGDQTRTEAGGWALRVTQLAVVATYFLAAWAKLRFGGLGWMTGSVLARAIIRRGTDFADAIASVPGLLIAAQVGIVLFEVLSPLVFLLRARWRYAVVAYFYSFHVLTFAMITISFAPHMAAMASFLPLERLRPIAWVRSRLRRTHAGAGPPGATPATAAPGGAAPERGHAGGVPRRRRDEQAGVSAPGG